ncbi:GGDEF domain-containing protein [Lysinibacillus sp. BW-2-10]|uniref:GGDEF domain-containing protein n=1 Tax=Lysinibacillus sp. BW-2-10 TaxID=2590030 RepID=UPI0011812FCA|nr:GGDEF domain-containing protein [Lysinibacillus sp. BW-2-10]TSI06200.1 GGDEF domain-containing protein [Lysinibacillus sp. BW-2-10]
MVKKGKVVTNIGRIAKTVPYIDPFVKNKEIDKLFTENPDMRSIVVAHQEKPVAHITRTHFYQKIGTQYGYNLYMGRESKLIANTNPLIVDYYQSITEVSKVAMERKEEDLYDDVIVTKDGKFAGVVSIRALLMKFVEIQVEQASYLNPLSNLPGNHLIDKKLNETLRLEKYSIIYFDLDHFKAYNDLYGFKKGDKVLLHLTEILKRSIQQAGFFLGHIGGDDFMAIIPHYEVDDLCAKVIKDFDETIPKFYKSEHLNDPNFKMKGRSGEMEKFAIMSLSIAVLTNEFIQFETIEDLSNTVAAVKRNCKKIKGSCYLIDECDCIQKV